MTHHETANASTRNDAEHARLADSAHHDSPWRAWGPYVAERAWGSVREDYSADGDAWANFPFEHARSRAYRWNEDGLAGFCDVDQTWCFALALWNGKDPILKERLFGLANTQGNHGEDVKERYWFVDGLPTHALMSWRYHYPQAEFPYEQLVSVNEQRSRLEPEYELDDTGAFDGDRYFDVRVDYAKAAPTDLCIEVTVRNAGPDTAVLDLLPTLWFRNTWAWGLPGAGATPRITCDGSKLVAVHDRIGSLTLSGDPTNDGFVTSIACDNETNTRRLYGVPGRSLYPKDGINDHVVHGAASVRTDGTGTKAALRYQLTLPPGERRSIRLRLRAGDQAADQAADRAADQAADQAAEFDDFDSVVASRRREADAFYEALRPQGVSDDEMRVVRQAVAGLLWSKQFYHYDVERWLAGDPAGPVPPPGRGLIRNGGWRHLNNADVLLMPDTWEYPWFAAWDFAFHCVVMAHVDPWFAKRQLLLLLREWYMHPNGQLPAYEWNFSDVNPPVHAWAALRVFEITGDSDYDFLERVFHKLLLNFTWWVNREDREGNNLFEGGFLGLDNVGPFDRSKLTPDKGTLEQSDGTAWMAMYCIDLLDMALLLAMHSRAYEDVATKFFEHFARISTAARRLWDDADGFFYDQLSLPSGERLAVKVRSLVGLIALCAVSHADDRRLQHLPDFNARLQWFLANKPELTTTLEHTPAGDTVFAAVDFGQLRLLLERMFDETEFLSPHGVRSVSAYHREHPFSITLDGQEFRVDYEPAESTTPLFGGNSNWRGPVWMPLNALLVESLRRFAQRVGPDFTVEVPTGSGRAVGLAEAADLLSHRLVSLFLPDADGRVPAAGDRNWPDGLLLFHEYFHGDTGAGLGASHQTGWTALVAHLVLASGRRGGSGS